MSRTLSRKRKRLTRREIELRDAVIKARMDDVEAAKTLPLTTVNGALWQLLRDIDSADLCIWDVARVVHCTEDERFMLAQAVDKYLSGSTAGSARRRHERAK